MQCQSDNKIPKSNVKSKIPKSNVKKVIIINGLEESKSSRVDFFIRKLSGRAKVEEVNINAMPEGKQNARYF